MRLITAEFLAIIRAHSKLDWNGIHGFAHWQRVRENGLRLAALNGAKADVIEYFAFTHDSQRQNDSHDPQHGQRAAQFILDHLLPYIKLAPADLDLLIQACTHHTGTYSHPSLTVLTRWDADRLDLMRARIPKFLSNVKMRFGKTFAAYQLAKRMGFRKVLDLTFKPSFKAHGMQTLSRIWILRAGISSTVAATSPMKKRIYAGPLCVSAPFRITLV